MPQAQATCALRALTLCDGNRLEEPDGHLTKCPHEVLSDPTYWVVHGLARQVLEESLEAVTPSLPF